MARTALTAATQAATNAATAITAQSGDNTNGNSILAEPKTRKLLFRIVAPAGGVTVTFKAGSDFPAQKRGQGDLALVLGANAVRFVTLDSMRFVNPDGNIYIDWSASGATIECVRMPDDNS